MSRQLLWVFVIFSGTLAFDSIAFGQPAAVRTDSAGDPLPPGAITRIGTTRFQQASYLSRVFFAPDSSTVIGKGGDKLIYWEAETGKILFEERDPNFTEFVADQSPDGALLALFGNDRRGKPAQGSELRLYDVATRKIIWSKTVDGPYHPYRAVQFTPDGKRLITGSGDVRVWDVKSGAELARESIQAGSRLVLSPDGKTIASGERDIWFWNWHDPAPARRVNTDRQLGIGSLAFSDDGKLLYISDYSNAVRAYEVASGKYMGRISELVFQARTISPDGKTAAVAEYDKRKDEGAVVLRDAVTGQEKNRLQCGSRMLGSLCWSKDGTKIAGASPFRAWVWDVKSGKAFGPNVSGHDDRISSLAFTSDGKLISCSEDHTVRTWDPATGRESQRIVLNERSLGGFAVSPDGDQFAGSLGSGEVRIWQAKTGKEVYRLVWSTSRTSGGVYKAVFSSDGQTVITFSLDWYVRGWDLLTGRLKVERSFRPAELGPPDDDRDEIFMSLGIALSGIAISPDGDTFVMPSGKFVTAYSVSTGKEKFKLEASPSALTLSPNGKLLLTASRERPAPNMPKGAVPAPTTNQVTVWNMADAKPTAQFSLPGEIDSRTLTFTPDSKRVVTTSSDGVLRFWDAVSGKALGTIELQRRPMQIAFGGDKLLAVAFAEPTILIYDWAAALQPAKKE